MVGRGRVDREVHWRGVIQDQKASGLSISAFCRQRGIPGGSFFNWRRKLAERDHGRAVEPEETGAKFVPVEIPAASAQVRPGCDVVLPDGCRIIIPIQCDSGWLSEILGALRERSC